MEDNISADGYGRTVIRMAEAENSKTEAEPTEKMKTKKMKKESVR